MTFESVCAVAACAISGVGLFGYGLHLRGKLLSCQSWPQADGKITQSGLEIDDGFRVCVTYQYIVNGVTYSSNRIEFGGSSTYSRKRSAQAALGQYPVESHLTVYYDPENPSEAVLNRKPAGAFIYIILGIALLAMAVLVMIYPARDTAQ